MSYTIHIDSHRKALSAQKGDLLVDKILQAGINLSVTCDKKGLCGKCLVEIVDGNLPPPNEQEKYLMKQKNYP
ncbi:MAG: 2Fe-2S iron-sulfur cluster binding domain-containing protein, partial [Candidatus Aminicenantes bacterium]|nr:2Fe-2S iron-sulfur cluster binding domain-containing protein [Candidatus Aminicenantes bacterium]